jgi:hypothetical protein
VASPLKLALVHWIMHNELEKQAQAGADAMLREQ